MHVGLLAFDILLTLGSNFDILSELCHISAYFQFPFDVERASKAAQPNFDLDRLDSRYTYREMRKSVQTFKVLSYPLFCLNVIIFILYASGWFPKNNYNYCLFEVFQINNKYIHKKCVHFRHS